MSNYFLLLAGQGYYPSSGTGDWIQTFESDEEARSVIKPPTSFSSSCTIYGKEYDWVEVVDLRDWILTNEYSPDSDFLNQMHSRMKQHSVVNDTAVVVLTAQELERLIKGYQTNSDKKNS